MIEIFRKEECVGCNSCVQKCPKSCISMNEDEQGFLYPKVDTNLCIDCNLCENVCPVINQAMKKKSLQTYAAKNKNPEVRYRSSSGGIFFALAETIINEGGVVFGAKFSEDWEVIHDYAETLEDLKAFQGSKYVQSRIGQSFLLAENFLKSGRKVLFTGTPCQIAGLKRFLRKEYCNLLTVDVVCHGVPSPLVWRNYLHYIIKQMHNGDGKNLDSQSVVQNKNRLRITNISFRDKRISWEKFGLSIQASNMIEKRELLFETLDKNLFMKGFLNDLFLRPSCYECPAKCGKSNSDITIADFWGIASFHHNLYDNKGVSLVLSNTKRGDEELKSLPIEYHQVDFRYALAGNPAIEHSPLKPEEASLFWQLWSNYGIAAINIALRKKRGSFPRRLFRWTSRRIDVFGKKIKRRLLQK